MIRMGAVGAVVLAASMAAVPFASASSDAGRAPSGHPAVRLTAGTLPGTFSLVSPSRRPLAVLAVRAGNGQSYRIVQRGTDFARAAVWVRIGAGALCWSERPRDTVTTITVREPGVPFAAPRAAWAWSTIVVIDRTGPHAFTHPEPGQTLSGGSRVRNVIACVDAAPVAKLRSNEPEAQVTLCHATSSTSNPYSLITVDESAVTKNGHGDHTGPLYPEPGWGDVIPPFGDYPGLNWPAGEGLLADGCAIAPPTEPTDPPDIEVTPPDPEQPWPPIDPPITIEPPIQPVDPSPTPTPTASVSLSPSATPTPTASTSPTPTASASLPPSATPTPTASTSATPTASASLSPSATPMPTASSPNSATPTPTTAPTEPTASPPTASPSAASPTTASPAPSNPTSVSRPLPGQVAFDLTDGRKRFTVTYPVSAVLAAARARPGVACPNVRAREAARPRGC